VIEHGKLFSRVQFAVILLRDTKNSYVH